MADEFMTMKEAMTYLGVSKAKMARLAKGLVIYEDLRDKRKRWIKREEVERLRQLRPREQMSFDQL